MSEIDIQKAYWDAVAKTKTFTHPIPTHVFRGLLSADARILDYGCGYGRTCSEFFEAGYRSIWGIDISAAMITRGHSLHPELALLRFDGISLPFADCSFDACTMLAVLTCIPTDAGQKRAIDEIHRVLRPGGVFFMSDYPLQSDTRNQRRYREFTSELGMYGVFRLSDGAVVRHHDMGWIHRLLCEFEILGEESIRVSTMNGNAADIFQIFARK
jgi:SAM-dependent methyltransferase